MNDKKLKLLRIITGILFAYLLILNIKSAINNPYWTNWFNVAGYLCMAISMFSGCYALLTIGAVGNAIPLCVSLLRNVIYMRTSNILYCVFCVLGILSYVLLMCAVGKKQSALKLCIAATIIAISTTIVNWIEYSTVLTINRIFNLLIRTLSIVLSGLVLKNEPVKKRSSATATQPSVSKVEALTKLKSLLDAGAISQEEFDAKKKQLLGV